MLSPSVTYAKSISYLQQEISYEEFKWQLKTFPFGYS